jgi:hypothetical protein
MSCIVLNPTSPWRLSMAGSVPCRGGRTSCCVGCVDSLLRERTTCGIVIREYTTVQGKIPYSTQLLSQVPQLDDTCKNTGARKSTITLPNDGTVMTANYSP